MSEVIHIHDTKEISDVDKIKLINLSTFSSDVENLTASVYLKKKSKSVLFPSTNYKPETDQMICQSMRSIKSSSNISKSANISNEKSQNIQHYFSNDTLLVTSSPVVNMNLDLVKYQNSNFLKVDLEASKKSNKKSNKKFHQLFPSVAISEKVLNSKSYFFIEIEIKSKLKDSIKFSCTSLLMRLC